MYYYKQQPISDASSLSAGIHEYWIPKELDGLTIRTQTQKNKCDVRIVEGRYKLKKVSGARRK